MRTGMLLISMLLLAGGVGEANSSETADQMQRLSSSASDAAMVRCQQAACRSISRVDAKTVSCSGCSQLPAATPGCQMKSSTKDGKPVQTYTCP